MLCNNLCCDIFLREFSDRWACGNFHRSHCDPAVNQHAQFVGMRKGVVERLFAIDARGPGW